MPRICARGIMGQCLRTRCPDMPRDRCGAKAEVRRLKVGIPDIQPSDHLPRRAFRASRASLARIMRNALSGAFARDRHEQCWFGWELAVSGGRRFLLKAFSVSTTFGSSRVESSLGKEPDPQNIQSIELRSSEYSCRFLGKMKIAFVAKSSISGGLPNAKFLLPF
jgi:hypothetical protein